MHPFPDLLPDLRSAAGAPRLKWAPFAFVLGTALLSLPRGATAQDAPSYADRAKTVIGRLLEGRDFTPETGCEDPAACTALLARLRAGEFDVLEPDERSERADMPTYLKARRKCRGLDLAHIVAAHHRSVATRNFALYRLDVARPARKGDDVLVFRAQHYVATGGRRDGDDEADERPVVWPGSFVAFGFPSCRVLSSAVSTEGDWFAKHNKVEDDDHVSELLTIGDRLFVLNLEPIAGPAQPRETWWYRLELWDWGERATIDRRKRRHIYSFSYRPPATYETVGAR